MAELHGATAPLVVCEHCEGCHPGSAHHDAAAAARLAAGAFACADYAKGRLWLRVAEKAALAAAGLGDLPPL